MKRLCATCGTSYSGRQCQKCVQASKDYNPEPHRDISVAQEAAAAFCAERGLKTPAQMVAYRRTNRPAIGKRVADLAWAHKILARVAAGEQLPLISVEMARLALRNSTLEEAKRQREPGDEQETEAHDSAW